VLLSLYLKQYFFAHRKDAKGADMIDFLFAVERRAKRNISVPPEAGR
jgi:hypothetical protein